jgi:tetratricopeptide (TPR) repeat protein
MNCKEVEERNILEGYLLERLSEPEREEFEMHYFECGSCFAQLQTGLTLQTELRRQPAMPARARGAGSRRAWVWAPAFATIIVLFISAGLWWYSARNRPSLQQVASPPKVSPNVPVQVQSPSAAPSLEELARVEPPPYSGLALRGAEDEAHETFRKAMQFYVSRDYGHAIPGVRAAAKASPQNASFDFYLGACYLLAGQTDPAIVSFRRTVSLGDPAYSESAHFYLAKAYLRKNKVARAKEELQKTLQFHGSLEAPAAEILRQLPD